MLWRILPAALLACALTPAAAWQVPVTSRGHAAAAFTQQTSRSSVLTMKNKVEPVVEVIPAPAPPPTKPVGKAKMDDAAKEALRAAQAKAKEEKDVAWANFRRSRIFLMHPTESVPAQQFNVIRVRVRGAPAEQRGAAAFRRAAVHDIAAGRRGCGVVPTYVSFYVDMSPQHQNVKMPSAPRPSASSLSVALPRRMTSPLQPPITSSPDGFSAGTAGMPQR